MYTLRISLGSADWRREKVHGKCQIGHSCICDAADHVMAKVLAVVLEKKLKSYMWV